MQVEAAKLVTEAPAVIAERLDDGNRRPARERYLAEWHAKYASRTTDFKRRAALYASYDERLSEYTRFFAARAARYASSTYRGIRKQYGSLS
jgi:hypothetical protein